LVFPTLKNYFNENKDDGLTNAINWLYPNGVYDPIVAMNNTILSATNEEGTLIWISLVMFFLYNYYC
jgi:hypothetical protein